MPISGQRGTTMKLRGKVLTGSTTTLTTKAGKSLEKTRLKVADQGDEVEGDLIAYWIDFLGEMALSDGEMGAVIHEEVDIDIRRAGASAGKQGGAFLNMTGGAITFQGKQLQGQFRKS